MKRKGKKYKKGNIAKKKKINTICDVFYQRERKINKLLNKFIHTFYNLKRPAIQEEYDDMNKMRLEIKRLFNLQECDIWGQSRRRKRFYFQQLNSFKYYYTMWKSLTYYIYLEQRYNCPLHLSPSLLFFIKHTHNISSTIYMI